MILYPSNSTVLHTGSVNKLRCLSLGDFPEKLQNQMIVLMTDAISAVDDIV